MNVKTLTRLANIKATETTPVEFVWKLLARRDISLVPVVSVNNTLVGVIGEDDLLYRLIPDYYNYFSDFFPDIPTMKDIQEEFEREILLTAEDVMNRQVVAVLEDQPIFKALAKMMANHIRWLPVVDEDNHYNGMIGEDDIMEYLFQKHQHAVKAKPKSRKRRKL